MCDLFQIFKHYGGKHYHDNTIIVSAYYHKFPFSESMANSTIMLVSFH